MFELNGIVYASEPTQDMRVEKVKDVGDFIVLVRFSTGETRLVDCTELFDMPAFAPLADETKFRTMRIVDGTLTWLDGKVDIAPEGLYARSYEYPLVV